jgi:cytochrome P450
MAIIDLLSPAAAIDPFPTYRLLRETAPICQVEPNGLWAISRFEDVRFALKRSDLFSSAGFIEAVYRPEWLNEQAHKRSFVLEEDPPQHTQHRSLINKAFVHRVVEAAEPLIRATAQTQIKFLRAQPDPDFVAHFGYPFVGAVIGHLIGVSDYLTLDEMQGVLRLMKNIPLAEPAAAEIQRLEIEFINYFGIIDRVIADRLKTPRQDLVTALLDARLESEQLGPERARHVIDLVLTAGLDTTIGLLCNAMMTLTRYPALFTKLKNQPELIPAFIEEQFRFDSSTHRLMRRTTTDISLHGKTIPAGSLTLVIMASANRDPDQFSDPDQFELSRPNIREHVAFGYGPHVCIGAALARRQAKIAIEELVRFADGVLCPPPEELLWEPSLITHAPDTQLPIRFL